MKNLEIKIKIDSYDTIDNIINILKHFYVTDLLQSDTYFTVSEGRLKLREESNKTPYMIYYQRPDLNSERYSDYSIFPITNVNMFNKVFSKLLHTELIIKKIRHLYVIKNARIHIDEVEDLGNFLEIEIVIYNTDDENNAPAFMQELQDKLDINHYPKIDCGYRELLLKFNNKISQ